MGLEDLSPGPRCPVHLANICQDHWSSCASGPPDSSLHDGHTGPWTAIDASTPPASLQTGDFIFARQTNRLSDGSIGDTSISGLHGIWRYDASAPVEDQQQHPWNGKYGCYIYCRDVETPGHRIYNEDFEALEITPQSMTGRGLYHLSPQQGLKYLEALTDWPILTTEPQELLEDVHDDLQSEL